MHLCGHTHHHASMGQQFPHSMRQPENVSYHHTVFKEPPVAPQGTLHTLVRWSRGFSSPDLLCHACPHAQRKARILRMQLSGACCSHTSLLVQGPLKAAASSCRTGRSGSEEEDGGEENESVDKEMNQVCISDPLHKSRVVYNTIDSLFCSAPQWRPVDVQQLSGRNHLHTETRACFVC